MEYTVQQIGIIHSPYKTKEQCPIQGVIEPEGKGEIEIFSEYEEGLCSIESFSHIILFYVFDKAGEILLSRPTFLDDNPHGVFASRHPCRPNNIGFSIVKLQKKINNKLKVSEIDILDNTPLIDIKPYIPKFDERKGANNGWVENLEFRDKPKNRE